ncbi:hypothetical protein WN48_00485 [Eufriesea mexicana]|nr:hypothetical protein WN48_00485 [Eufriesea mexicana]
MSDDQSSTPQNRERPLIVATLAKIDSMVGEMVVEAGKNVTLNCPGVTENSLILMLEWRVNSMQLLEYSSNTTIVWNHQNRVSLSLKNYALQFHPVTAQDTGEYTCLVNSRSMPEAVISLIVHADGTLKRGQQFRISVTSAIDGSKDNNSRERPQQFRARERSFEIDARWSKTKVASSVRPGRSFLDASNSPTNYYVGVTIALLQRPELSKEWPKASTRL